MTARLHVVEDGDAFDDFTEYLWSLGLAPKSVRIYRRLVERFLAFAMEEGFDPLQAGVMDLAGYAQTLPHTAASKRQHRVALRHWFECHGRTDAPLKAIRVPPRKRPRSRALEPDQARRLAHAARDEGFPKGTAVLFGLYLGLRREEIARARWDGFDREVEWYTCIGKRDVTAEIPVHPVIAEWVDENITAYPYVFPGRSSAHIGPPTIGAWTAEVGATVGLELTPHVLRHTAIATVNDTTGDLRMAPEFARHADIETTVIYTRVGAQRLRAAMETLNFLDD